MRPLSVPTLLNVWERGLAALPFERALAILSAAHPDRSESDLAGWSIGQRDALLFRLREWAFGSDLTMLASCPRCGQPMEIVTSVAELCPPTELVDEAEMSLDLEDYEVRFRNPRSEDLAVCAGVDVNGRERSLLRQCVIELRHFRKPVALENLPGEVIETVTNRIAEADPRADVRLTLTCPECEHCWAEAFDITSFFWTEIDAWARRILGEVHSLASAYGWSEDTILGLSPMRRQIYLAMAHS